MSGILDDLGILSENPSQLFGIAVDDVIHDDTSQTFKTGVFANNTVTTYLQSRSEINDAEAEIAGMPFAGKIVGVIYMIANNPATSTTTFHININGVRAASDILAVASTESGQLISDTLDISFNAGDRVQIERVRSGSTTAETLGAFGVCVNYS